MYVVYKIPYRRARSAFRPSASREQRYLAYNNVGRGIIIYFLNNFLNFYLIWL